MTPHLVTVSLRQRTMLGGLPRSDQRNAAVDHIPGAVLRGAFAAAWIRAHGVPARGSAHREEFVELFEGGVRFGPLYAKGGPVPLSVLQHKYPATADCPFDELDRAVDSSARDVCPECGSPLEQARGLRREDEPKTVDRVGLRIHPSGVAAHGHLFTQEELKPAAFTGEIIGDPAVVARLDELAALRIGGNRATHGWAQAAVRPGAPGDRIQTAADGTTLVLRLASPAVLVDDLGRPVASPCPAELARVLGPRCEITSAWSRWDAVGGWHAASDLPKPTDTVVVAGSTWIVRSADGTPFDPQRVRRLGLRGIGLRRHEGFGHLTGPVPVRTEPPARTETLDAQAVGALAGVSGGVWAGVVRPAADGDPQQVARLRSVAPRMPIDVQRAVERLLAAGEDHRRSIIERVEARRQR
jgi:CRISPR-associated protein Csx10